MSATGSDHYGERVARLADRLEAAGASVALIGSAAGMTYLTGAALEPFERFFGLVVRPGHDPRLIVPRVDAALARANPAGVEVTDWTEPAGPGPALAQVLQPSDVVAIEKRVLTVAVAEQIEALAPGVRFADVSPTLDGLRARKDAHELASIAKAATAIDACMADVPEILRPGATELEVAIDIRRLALAHGARVVYQPIVLFGERAADPHGTPSERVLGARDTALIDFECVVDGYFADSTRNFALGEPGTQYRELLDVVAEAARTARALVGPGIAAGAVDAAARATIAAAGHGAAFVHRTGHGLGLEPHEAPFLAEGEKGPLEAGAVVAIEPGIYLPGVGGVRVEDVVSVTERGADVLTNSERGLIEC